MRKLLIAAVAALLAATVGAGSALAAGRAVPQRDYATVIAQDTSGISGNVNEVRLALAEPSAVRYKIVVVPDSLPEDREAYLDRIVAQWGWPEHDQLYVVIYADANYDVRFAMGADFQANGVSVEEMVDLVHTVYLPEVRKGDSGQALAAFVRAVNKRMLPAAGLTPEQVVQSFYWQWLGYHSVTDRSVSGNRLVDKSYRQVKHLAPALIAKLDAQVAAMEKQGAGADPILCAQNVPEQITFGTATIAGDKAVMAVNTHWAGGATVRALKVELAKLQGAWQITNVACPAN